MDLRTVLGRSPRILVADDDWLNRDLLQAYLVNAGCEVFAVSDGQQAWQIAQTHQLDLALLDIRMPYLDGLSLCKRLKNYPPTSFVPVIIVTALDAEDEELHAIDAGADDFVNKPFNSLIMLTRVRSLLMLKKMSDDLQTRNQLLRQVLNRYVDPEIAEIILDDPERHLKLGGETRNVTVLFADLRGFTTFTEIHSAVQVVEMLNLVFDRLVEAVFQHGGTFDKFLGDAVMAFYGAPVSAPDDTLRAVQTAMNMQSRFAQMQAQYPALSVLGLGIGIHAGDAIVGNIGTDRIMDYTVIGDTVNIARRLQEAAQAGEILISETIVKLVAEAQVQNLPPQLFPGRRELLTVYKLVGLQA